MSARENIRVIPDTLNNVVVAVQQGQYRIPQFQRECVWERTKVIERVGWVERQRNPSPI
jgi:hypothetical protein